ncbi:Rv3235 family protein [Kineococcus sp. SYSU DK004]|uniref:Rv3235 family protein n=1 Tax=Kineococcus sp. SYSU DK004 TaxID=3383125 RepID=UPI003D7D1FA3
MPTALATAPVAPAPVLPSPARPRLLRRPVPLAAPPLVGQPGEVRSIFGHVSAGQGVLPLEVPDAARRPVPSELPEPTDWTRRYVHVLFEVLAARRPPQQLLRACSADVYAYVQRRAVLVAQTATRAPARAGALHRAVPARPPVVVRVLVSRPLDDVVEACAVVRDGERHRAVALRLEATGTRWRVTALEL